MSEQCPELKRFIRMAKRGKHPGASGGEKRAYALATAILHNVPGLDSQAVEGLHDFIDATQSQPATMIEQMSED